MNVAEAEASRVCAKLRREPGARRVVFLNQHDSVRSLSAAEFEHVAPIRIVGVYDERIHDDELESDITYTRMLLQFGG